MNKSNTLISIIVPMLNEAGNVPELYKQLHNVLTTLNDYDFEIIFVDDGSTDNSVAVVQSLEKTDKKVRLLRLARNFGKEIATTAGLHYSKGKAAIMIDADLQHPPELIPKLLKQWNEGFDVVIGRRHSKSVHAGLVKRATSRWFYRIMNRISMVEVTPHASDYRLLDRVVIDEFNRFTERNRLTRGLIDWLGFSRTYVGFTPSKRHNGNASYTYKSLVKLATNSIVSLSFFPLRLAGYLGVIIIFISAPLGLFIFIERYVLNDPLHLHFSGPAILAVILLFLIGIVLVCLGLIALYIANIYGEVVNRPLYVEKHRKERS